MEQNYTDGIYSVTGTAAELATWFNDRDDSATAPVMWEAPDGTELVVEHACVWPTGLAHFTGRDADDRGDDRWGEADTLTTFYTYP